MPTLVIIAGPNGAGKSTNSKEFIFDFNIEAFDFDKEFYSVWSQFNFDPALESNLQEKILNLYSERKQSAIRTMSHFAFETNYHTVDVLHTRDIFKTAGYDTVLNFILLESEETAIERVKTRVAKGGHGVEEDTIRIRFKRGLQLLDESFEQYNQVNIYHSITNKVNAIACIQPLKGMVLSSGIFVPQEIESHLPNLVKFLNEHKNE